MFGIDFFGTKPDGTPAGPEKLKFPGDRLPGRDHRRAYFDADQSIPLGAGDLIQNFRAGSRARL